MTAGEIMAYDGDDPTCTPMRYETGQGFVDPGNGHVHLLRNETDAPAETVAVQILPKDSTRRIDAPAPGNCSFSSQEKLDAQARGRAADAAPLHHPQADAYLARPQP